jgi:hypothetical protein
VALQKRTRSPEKQTNNPICITKFIPFSVNLPVKCWIRLIFIGVKSRLKIPIDLIIFTPWCVYFLLLLMPNTFTRT